MHALLVLSSLILVVVSGCLALAVLRRLDGWPYRRQMHLTVLTAPLVGLAVSVGAFHHFLGRTCFLGTPSWDYVAGVVLPVGMAVIALGGLGLGIVRLAIVHVVLGRRGRHADAQVQGIIDHLAVRLEMPEPHVLISRTSRPLALTLGVRRPAIVLSEWMFKHLDSHELESVLAHELAHVARRDYLVTWLATVLRDAFFYLPTSCTAYRQFQYERELACDDLAVKATGRPLALASALAKVWEKSFRGQAFDPAQALASSDQMIEQRIARLLVNPRPQVSVSEHWRIALGPGVQSLLGLATLLAANAVVTLTPMGCGPGSLVWKL